MAEAKMSVKLAFMECFGAYVIMVGTRTYVRHLSQEGISFDTIEVSGMPRRKSKARIVRMPAGELKPGLTQEDRALVESSLQSTLAEGTRKVYYYHFAYFEEWCKPRGIDPMEAEAEHVQVYLARMSKTRGLSTSSVQCAASAIKKVWLWGDPEQGRKPRASDCDWEVVLNVVDGIRKGCRRRPARATGLTRRRFLVILENVGKPMKRESPRKAARRAAFDIALIAVMKDLMSRREATSQLVWGDIQLRLDEGRVFGAVTIPLGKTDRKGRRQMGYLCIDTLAYLQKMAELCGRDPRDPRQLVFRIGDRQISNRIKAACRHAGLKGNFSGHSPRVGTAEDLKASGASLLEVMQAGGWSSPRVAAHYTEGAALAEGAMARYHSGLAEGRVVEPDFKEE